MRALVVLALVALAGCGGPPSPNASPPPAKSAAPPSDAGATSAIEDDCKALAIVAEKMGAKDLTEEKDLRKVADGLEGIASAVGAAPVVTADAKKISHDVRTNLTDMATLMRKSSAIKDRAEGLHTELMSKDAGSLLSRRDAALSEIAEQCKRPARKKDCDATAAALGGINQIDLPSHPEQLNQFRAAVATLADLKLTDQNLKERVTRLAAVFDEFATKADSLAQILAELKSLQPSLRELLKQSRELDGRLHDLCGF